MQAGKFVGRFVTHSFGLNEKTGNRYVQIAFQLLGGKVDAEVVKMTKALTEKTADQLFEIYRALGWNGQTDLTALTARQLSRLVSIDVQETEFDVQRNGRTERARGFEASFVRPITAVKAALSAEESAGFTKDLLQWSGQPMASEEEYDPSTGEILDGENGAPVQKGQAS